MSYNACCYQSLMYASSDVNIVNSVNVCFDWLKGVFVELYGKHGKVHAIIPTSHTPS